MLKRGMVRPKEYLCCNEKDTINHFFSEYVAAKCIWLEMSDILLMQDFESISGYCIRNEIITSLNILCSAHLGFVIISCFFFFRQNLFSVELIWEKE